MNLVNPVEMILILPLSDVMKEVGRDADAAIVYAQESDIKLLIKGESDCNKPFVDNLTSDEVCTYIDEKTEKTKKSLF